MSIMKMSASGGCLRFTASIVMVPMLRQPMRAYGSATGASSKCGARRSSMRKKDGIMVVALSTRLGVWGQGTLEQQDL